LCLRVEEIEAVAVLQVLKGSRPGQVLELRGERMIVGRHPNCLLVLDNVAVSRHHAQILESHGNYYLEDLRSRNGTYLNGTKITGRTELHESDEIKVCEVVLRFHRNAPTGDSVAVDGGASPNLAPENIANPRLTVEGLPPEMDEAAHRDAVDRQTLDLLPERGSFWAVGEEPDDDPADQSSVISTLDGSGSGLRLGVKPEAKLRAVLEIGSSLGKILDVDQVLQKILDCLFKIFPQAEEGFVLLENDQTGKLAVRATKLRSGDHDDSVRISMTIVRKAFETRSAILSADAAQDSRFDRSESLADYRIRSMVCAPLLGQSGEALGVIQIATNVRHRFSQDDLEILVSVAGQAAMAVENARLHEELLKQRDFERDLEFATQIQLGFLPSVRPNAPGYEFFDYYEAAHRVGGDYFDYIPLPDGRVVAALGDVAGKGVPAALLMARLYSSARYHLLTKPTIAEALGGLNGEIASSGLGHRFITFVLAVVDPSSHELTLANAGHLPPLLRDGRKKVHMVGRKESGLPLGVLADQEFEEIRLTLSPGDAVVMFTDGITEAMNDKNEIYSRRRLSRFIGHGPEDVAELVEGIVEDVETFSKGRTQRDDMCLVALRRLPEGS
jgi:phosphoserine phosphatase RsbU/P